MSVGKQTRHDVLAYDDLLLVGKISAWLGQRVITSRLRRGSWLDLLSGSQARLLQSQRNNPRIEAFHACDHRLDPGLESLGFHLHESYIDTSLPFSDDTFDNVTIINGLEHLWHPQEIITECHRILRPGGILQIVVPTWFGKPFLELLAFRLRNRQAYIEMNDHKMYYDERSLWPMMVRAGFTPEHLTTKRIKFHCSLYAAGVKASADGSHDVDQS